MNHGTADPVVETAVQMNYKITLREFCLKTGSSFLYANWLERKSFNYLRWNVKVCFYLCNCKASVEIFTFWYILVTKICLFMRTNANWGLEMTPNLLINRDKENFCFLDVSQLFFSLSFSIYRWFWTVIGWKILDSWLRVSLIFEALVNLCTCECKCWNFWCLYHVTKLLRVNVRMAKYLFACAHYDCLVSPDSAGICCSVAQHAAISKVIRTKWHSWSPNVAPSAGFPDHAVRPAKRFRSFRGGLSRLYKWRRGRLPHRFRRYGFVFFSNHDAWASVRPDNREISGGGVGLYLPMFQGIWLRRFNDLVQPLPEKGSKCWYPCLLHHLHSCWRQRFAVEHLWTALEHPAVFHQRHYCGRVFCCGERILDFSSDPVTKLDLRSARSDTIWQL